MDGRNAFIFSPADILLPTTDTDLTTYSVIACDQFTAEPAYWEGVFARTEGLFSTSHMVFPEVLLSLGDAERAARIASINRTMQEARTHRQFTSHPDCLIYLQRTLRNGEIRHGLIGKIDLEHYDFRPDSTSAVRATEGTVLERIPPRVQIRQNAPLEFPHILLLLDDPTRHIIEPLASQTSDFSPLYDFPLMKNSGHLRGWKLSPTAQTATLDALAVLGNAPASSFSEAPLPLLYAVGDGNHSLATAKACYEQLRSSLSPTALLSHPARYALVELGNLHDESLSFEPIHRVVFHSSPQDLVTAFGQRFGLSRRPLAPGEEVLQIVVGDTVTNMTVDHPDQQLTVGVLQQFLDDYLADHPEAEVDYIHGSEVVLSLCAEADDRIGFLLPSFAKERLFPAVNSGGPLPRKTFSMGEAWDKRFYLEARSIQE